MQSSLYWNSTLRADYALKADVLDPMFTGGLVLLDISGNSISSSGCIVIANQISKNRWLQGDCGKLIGAVKESQSVLCVLVRGNPGFTVETAQRALSATAQQRSNVSNLLTTHSPLVTDELEVWMNIQEDSVQEAIDLKVEMSRADPSRNESISRVSTFSMKSKPKTVTAASKKRPQPTKSAKEAVMEKERKWGLGGRSAVLSGERSGGGKEESNTDPYSAGPAIHSLNAKNLKALERDAWQRRRRKSRVSSGDQAEEGQAISDVLRGPDVSGREHDADSEAVMVESEGEEVDSGNIDRGETPAGRRRPPDVENQQSEAGLRSGIPNGDAFSELLEPSRRHALNSHTEGRTRSHFGRYAEREVPRHTRTHARSPGPSSRLYEEGDGRYAGEEGSGGHWRGDEPNRSRWGRQAGDMAESEYKRQQPDPRRHSIAAIGDPFASRDRLDRTLPSSSDRGAARGRWSRGRGSGEWEAHNYIWRETYPHVERNAQKSLYKPTTCFLMKTVS
eukprot:gene830-922_t